MHFQVTKKVTLKLGALSSATLKRDAKILRGDRKDFEHKYNKDAVNKAASEIKLGA